MVTPPAALVACLLAASLLLLAPTGILHAEVPAPGTDVLNGAGSIELQITGVGTGYVHLTGQMTIVRYPPDPGTPGTIPIEIVSLSLSGIDPLFGPVQVQMQPGPPTIGGVMMPLPAETPADSFFDVFLQIDLPALGRSFSQSTPFHIEAMTGPIPFFDVFTEVVSQQSELIDMTTGLPAGALTHLSLDPHPRVDILATVAQMSWTIDQTSETVQMNGPSVVVRSESFDPGGGMQAFNTEIVEMTLTGSSPNFGPLQFDEQATLHSPGQSRAQQPGPAQYPADSFFDVFFDIAGSFFDVECADPLAGRATINGWPPIGTPYASPSPCALVDAASGRPMGTLDSFSWVWVQTGQCADADGDGVLAPPCGTDCDDNDPNNYPGNLEICTDGADNNCNQAVDCADPVCLGRPCDDGNPCTAPDVCTQSAAGGGFCLGQPIDCDDNDPCTIDTCAAATGQCLHIPVSCDDQDACTLDSCDPATGACKHAPLSCDDGNQCTADFCDPAAGCQHQPLFEMPCDDGNPCTAPDLCLQGPQGGVVCRGFPVDCDDGNACTVDSCNPVGCVAPDNGSGTADIPAAACAYTSDGDLMIIDGLPAGTTIRIPSVQKSFFCPTASGVCSFAYPVPGVDCSQGTPVAGEQACADSTLAMHMIGTGALLGFDRMIDVTVGVEEHLQPRVPGTLVQSFDTDMFRLYGQLPIGDPDFDLLRIVGGTDFGLPSPGHTTLTQMGGGNWAVDSFFDITYRIDFIGNPSGPLGGMSGSTTATIRMSTGGGLCTHTPVSCDDQNPCTIDSCDPASGTCAHTPVSCDDGNACTADSCDPASGGCVNVPVDCDDGDACTLDSCNPVGCVAPDNGSGTADIPAAACSYTSDGDLMIIDGLPPGTTIRIPSVQKSFFCPGTGSGVCSFAYPVPGVDCSQGSPALGEQACADSTLAMHMIGTGALLGFDRMIDLSVSLEEHLQPRVPGTLVQSFDTDMFRLYGQLPIGDPDFDLLRIVGGTDFGLPSPGHTTLTQMGGGNWAVDSFFDITYRIDFVGHPGGALGGMSGSTTGTIRMSTGGGVCTHTPVGCDDQNPCTIDSCDPASGTCAHTPVSCDDGNACTADACDPASGGCVNTPVDCDDGNACTVDGCNPVGCVAPDNGSGTADIPAAACSYTSDGDLMIIDGLPAGTTIRIPSVQKSFFCPTASGVCSFPYPVPGVDCSQGTPVAGEQACADSTLAMHMIGTGALLGFDRMIDVTVGVEEHLNARAPGTPVQSFDTDMFRLFGQIMGDPDFDLLRIVGGTDFGLPSPGHTTLTQMGGGNWAVDSFFDITYRIDFVGAPGGVLGGRSGSTTGTIRMSTGGGVCTHTPVSCDDQNPCTIDSCDPAAGGCVNTPIPVLEPNPMRFIDQTTMGWGPTPDATHWNTYRGTIPATLLGRRLPGAVYDHACYESDDAHGNGPTTAIDPGNPPLGTGYYYQISGESTCGESVVGHDSAGGVVPNAAPCPTPP